MGRYPTIQTLSRLITHASLWIYRPGYHTYLLQLRSSRSDEPSDRPAWRPFHDPDHGQTPLHAVKPFLALRAGSRAQPPQRLSYKTATTAHRCFSFLRQPTSTTRPCGPTITGGTTDHHPTTSDLLAYRQALDLPARRPF